MMAPEDAILSLSLVWPWGRNACSLHGYGLPPLPTRRSHFLPHRLGSIWDRVAPEQLATLIVRDFALMYAICKASADILMQVEHHSTVMQRAYEELRDHFQAMFVRANPSTSDMLDACFQAFAQFDADGSGHLSHREFSELIRHLTGEAASGRMLRRLLRMIDVDASGKVEVQEFLRFAAPLEVEGGPEISVEDLELRIEQLAHMGAPGRAGGPTAIRAVPKIPKKGSKRTVGAPVLASV